MKMKKMMMMMKPKLMKMKMNKNPEEFIYPLSFWFVSSTHCKAVLIGSVPTHPETLFHLRFTENQATGRG